MTIENNTIESPHYRNWITFVKLSTNNNQMSLKLCNNTFGDLSFLQLPNNVQYNITDNKIKTETEAMSNETNCKLDLLYQIEIDRHVNTFLSILPEVNISHGKCSMLMRKKICHTVEKNIFEIFGCQQKKNDETLQMFLMSLTFFVLIVIIIILLCINFRKRSKIYRDKGHTIKWQSETIQINEQVTPTSGTSPVFASQGSFTTSFEDCTPKSLPKRRNEYQATSTRALPPVPVMWTDTMTSQRSSVTIFEDYKPNPFMYGSLKLPETIKEQDSHDF